MNLDFLSSGKKERKIFDWIMGLLDTVSVCVESFVASVTAHSMGDLHSAWESEAKVFRRGDDGGLGPSRPPPDGG
ncbi:MAG: hypothetical protein JRN59_06905 [Nitrososphaerota archaeon]|nr:hypothetical protein [Nitrososphaerota archaeon]